jgi:hypothetical protein
VPGLVRGGGLKAGSREVPHDAIRLSFKIDAFQPDTLPMDKLAEYMADLAAMLGEKADVHFVSLEDGCVELVHDVAFTAYPKIQARTVDINLGVAPAEAMKAYRSLNRRLASDNTFATYADISGAGGIILEFPGARAPKPVEIRPVEQPGSLVGTIQGVGAKTINDARIPVYVDTGDVVHACAASRATAKELGPFILGEPRRFEGLATWQRDDDGAWELKRFVIKTHEPVEDAPLSEVIERLRNVPSGLTELRDPWGDLMSERRDEGEPN